MVYSGKQNMVLLNLWDIASIIVVLKRRDGRDPMQLLCSALFKKLC